MAEVADNLKKIQLDAYHREMGAKMVPFAGFDMPVQYAGVNEEHRQVREGVGVFDVSHMGEFVVSGKEALNLIQHITSNDASKLYDGKVQYSCFPNKEGGIVDDLLVYRFTDEQYLLVVNASNIEKDWNWIKENNTFDAKVEDKSDDYTLLAVQGPKAIDVVQPLTDLDLGSMKYYTFQVGTIAGQENILISTTGYTGAGGFEIYIRNEVAQEFWKALYEEGKKHGLAPIGLAARDTLRLEMGFCLYGNDIDDTTSPIEAGLSWITKFSKDFINKPQIQKHKEEGVDRRLVGFELTDRGIPRKGYDIVDAEGTKIGVVTSGTMSPSLGKAIGMGYVANSHKSEGSEIGIQIRNKTIAAKVVALPFYKG